MSGYLYKHFDNIRYLYGEAGVQIPNDLFRQLAVALKGKGKKATNIQQVSFAYAYLVTIAFLYKYAHYVDIDNGTYIQNSDIKQILGYGKTTKTVDKIIKKGGILDKLGLTKASKDYPIRFTKHPTETINDIPLREFTTIKECDIEDAHYITIKNIVKNRNYEIKEPLFLTQEYGENDYGTLYSFENTHKVTIEEFIHFVYSQDLNNIDLLLYSFFKSKCQGLEDNMKSIALHKITLEIGMGKDTFYSHLEKLKKKGYIDVIHKGWRMSNQKYEGMDANEYYFKGVIA